MSLSSVFGTARAPRVGLGKGVLVALILAGWISPPAARADVTWPPEQLLPSFSAPAERQDLIFLRGPTSTEDELPLFASLKGVVNAEQPRIFSYEGDAFAEGPYTWLESLGLSWTEHADNWTLIGKYGSELDGVIVYDPLVPDTLNLATTLAGPARALIASPTLAERLTGAPYDLPVIEDLRGRFTGKLDVYESLLEDHWPLAPQRVLFGLSPLAHKASLREYAVALGGAVIWLDPQVPGESELLDRFLTALGPGGAFMGWWPEEQPGVQRASEHGVATVASDFATNLTLHSGMPKELELRAIPPKPRLEDKLYVAFILSDGDNLQYVEHLMRKLWNDPGRGQVPIGWTVSPAMLDAMPGALAFYSSSATLNDNLISGPSGWGYAYPNSWPSAELLEDFVAKTDDYARRSGLRVLTVWNTIVGGIDPDVGDAFATHAPSLLGLTAQNTGGGLTVYADSLPSFALSCNYCTGEQAMRDHIDTAAAGWDGQSPRFILIQAQPWQNVTPTSFRNVQTSLGDDYVVVRPDHWFQLMRQAQGIRIEPIQPVEAGVYRLLNEASGKCVAVTTAEAGAAVVQRECENDDSQRWRVLPTSAGYARLASLLDEQLVLDLDGGGAATENGAQAMLAQASDSTSQEWQPVWESGELYHVLSRVSDRCFDVPSGTRDDVQLQQWECNGATAQAFRFASPILEPPADGAGGGGGTTAGGASSGGASSGGASGGGAAGGSAESGAAGSGFGGSTASGASTTSDGGCGCATAARFPGGAKGLAALCLAALFARRRRRAPHRR